jgi:anti-sigma28 factor (negative regulator of flagellin synthesis)
MEISLINKTKTVQPQPSPEAPQDAAKSAKISGEGDRSSAKSKVDSAEISSAYAGISDDKRLSVAKSSILSELAVSASEQRLGALREQVRDEAYEVPDDTLADALLG